MATYFTEETGFVLTGVDAAGATGRWFHRQGRGDKSMSHPSNSGKNGVFTLIGFVKL